MSLDVRETVAKEQAEVREFSISAFQNEFDRVPTSGQEEKIYQFVRFGASVMGRAWMERHTIIRSTLQFIQTAYRGDAFVEQFGGKWCVFSFLGRVNGQDIYMIGEGFYEE